MKKLLMLSAAVAALSPTCASASDWVTLAKVVLIETTYAPGHLPFQIDRAGGSCAAGAFLTWFPKGADAAAQANNYQAILATLLTAKAAGQSITVYGNNNGCTIDYLYIS